MTLDLNSWHAKYYQMILDKNPPKTLCPYFWIMVVLVIFSPLVLLAHYIFVLSGKMVDNRIKKNLNKPVKIKKTKPFDEEKQRRKDLRFERTMEVIGKILTVISILVIVLLCLLLVFVTVKSAGIWMFLVFGFAIVGFIFTMVRVVQSLIDIRVGHKFIKSSFVQIPKEMIIAIYTKSCPRVTWVGEPQKQVNN